MASRRMIANMIVDSDAFLDMPNSTQNLYFHLNVRADDEGFIDNPKKIMRAVGANQNDLEILIAKRYILIFESGVVVIKHWKLHNCIRKDRFIPTVYKEERNKLTEKENGAYTDRPLTTICQPDDNQVSTICQHRLGKDSIGKVSIGKDSADDDKPSIGSLITESIKYWNSKSNLPTCKYTILNLPLIAEVKPKYDVYTIAEIKKAIDNLSELYDKEVSAYRPSAFHKFIVNSIDRWTDDVKPHDRYKKVAKNDDSCYNPAEIVRRFDFDEE